METQKISVEEIGKTQSELDHDRGLQGTITVQGHVDDIGSVSVVYIKYLLKQLTTKIGTLF